MIEARITFKPQGAPEFRKRRIFNALPRLGETIIFRQAGIMNGGRWTVTEVIWEINGEPEIVATDSRRAPSGWPVPEP